MPPSVVVTGFLADAIGVGEAARGYAEALAAAGLDVALHPIDLPGRPPSPAPLPDLPVVDAGATADVVVHALNPPELAHFRAEGRRLPTGRRTVGIWAWEVDPLPEWWPDEVAPFDELWAYTEPVAARLRAAVDVPVVAEPPPVRLGAAGPAPAADPPTVVTLADAWSSLDRKNPLGAVRAFRAAVPPGAGPRLVVKLRSGAADPGALAALHEATVDRDDIELVDRFLERDALLDLVASAACLLSLHRAEGLGLPLFEALALGVPVVCTAGSGPGELLPGTAARLVAAEPVPIGPGRLHYPAEGTWLEPDVGDAARHLRAVLADPDAARADARAASAAVADRFSAARVGAALRARVDDLLRPTASVVVHGTLPWPALRPILDEVRSATTDAEVVVATPDPAVVPEEVRGDDVRVVVVPTRSPFRLRRAAVDASRGDLLVVTEDHCIPHAGWVDAYAECWRATGAPVLAGPVGNGSPGTLADWANYLIGIAAWSPPLDRPPPHFGPTVANVAVARDRAVANGSLERDVLPRLWGAAPRVVPSATVDHVQPNPLWRHARNHFDDCRTAGAHERATGIRRSVRPTAIAAEARRWLRLASESVGPRPELHDLHRRTAWHLRVLALARAVGLAVGNRLGAGRSAERLE